MIKKQTEELETTKERIYFTPIKIKFDWVQNRSNSYALFIGDRHHLVATVNRNHGQWHIKPHKFIKGHHKENYKYSPQLSLEETKDYVENELKEFIQTLRSK